MKKWYIVSCSVYYKSNVPYDFLYTDYIRFFESFGMDIIPVLSSSGNVYKYFKRLDIGGIILTGGNDITPEFRGAKPSRYINSPSPERDFQESRLLGIAVKLKIPVLGICRGMQFINCYFGGTLIDDIKLFEKNAGEHIGKSHLVSIVDKSCQELFGRNEIRVNSYHHQGMKAKEVGQGLKVWAIGKDDIVEAIFHEKYPIAGIQWHPERKGCARNVNELLLRSFVNRTIFWKKR